MKADLPSGIFAWCLIISGGAPSDQSTDILATDLQSGEAAEVQESGTPILLLFSDEYCGYCKRLKKEVLEPLERNGKLRNIARIREVDINRGGKIRDFDGEKVRTRVFVGRYGIYATPTLMLIDKRGNPLGTPIVGFNDRADYIAYLEQLKDISTGQARRRILAEAGN